ncbi:MAG: histidinol-phosphate aminotransferase family protein, partial [Acidimicrobiia bacterium]|nr:histidinol-phosphate aminotransferase family protein [Acidimicrobiia bacterium]
MPDSRPVHGGLDAAELKALGLRPDGVVDFSASINPLGVSPRVAEAIRRVDLAAYPDPECT